VLTYLSKCSVNYFILSSSNTLCEKLQRSNISVYEFHLKVDLNDSTRVAVGSLRIKPTVPLKEKDISKNPFYVLLNQSWQKPVLCENVL
jgi:hypothetical protein